MLGYASLTTTELYTRVSINLLRNDEMRFMEFRVAGGTLVWPTGADMCSDVLIWGGLPPADVAAGSGWRGEMTSSGRCYRTLRLTA